MSKKKKKKSRTSTPRCARNNASWPIFFNRTQTIIAGDGYICCATMRETTDSKPNGSNALACPHNHTRHARAHLLKGSRPDVMPQDVPEVVRVHPKKTLAVEQDVPQARPHPPEPRRHQQLPERRVLVLVVPAGGKRGRSVDRSVGLGGQAVRDAKYRASSDEHERGSKRASDPCAEGVGERLLARNRLLEPLLRRRISIFLLSSLAPTLFFLPVKRAPWIRSSGAYIRHAREKENTSVRSFWKVPRRLLTRAKPLPRFHTRVFFTLQPAS